MFMLLMFMIKVMRVKDNVRYDSDNADDNGNKVIVMMVVRMMKIIYILIMTMMKRR